ncbi:MAG: AMP-dependent synthetase [Spirochaetes bacterium GWD1_61_31]|nr:MAG: AMP-dependent synthetase [Spirochaetes bacterium GWB1_60_80]OHD34895.1 MAG: AMP-dependent synthetase [Spirochaetes bacterium GWC1_61_12]OHD37076.1 MAG: AMP-dependent synthetase [Spirochaetes bacterium GWD1_61_31]OHD44659.1 MAG: AMP-dependent synthetase [Spirochaetes bacterium GWE1_60_18]OHD61066.1 MAG: AMP-dependent synthetase [Spirochaetes bacterium GWF1_60_12]HAP42725.1 long-chain fatty acid--CoA ligase [Spirochaetaceae bacterium]
MAETIPLLFLDTVRQIPRSVAQYSKQGGNGFQPTSYTDLAVEVAAFAAGLAAVGVKRGDNIGLIADNRKEWLICDLAILGLGAVDVPRGCDATDQEISYILSFSQCATAIAETEKQVDKILARRADLPRLRQIIAIDKCGESMQAKADQAGVSLLAYAEVFANGQPRLKADPSFYEREAALGKRDQMATIIYTSGTTGEPKGVMLSHGNFLHQVETLPERLALVPGMIWLSVLPVWHSYERMVQYAIIGVHDTIAYSKPIGAVMLPDFQAINPQWMASVPRIWESVMDGVNKSIRQSSAAKKAIFAFCLSVGRNYANFRNMLLGRYPNFGDRTRLFDSLTALLPLLILLPFRGLAEVLVFKKIKVKLGNKFVAGISGGGAIPPAVDDFFDAMGIQLLEGYGLTETAPIVALRRQKNPTMGTVGAPLVGTEFRIVDDEDRDLGLFAKGHVQIRGPQVMLGYYQKPELTAKAFTPDGWLRTGDIGLLAANRALKLTGRAKDTIVLRGGENVEPIPIEQKLVESVYIKQAVVLGQNQRHLAALLVPDQDVLTGWAKENNVPYIDYESLLLQPETLELFDYEVSQLVNPRNGFKIFERILRHELLPNAFAVDRELSAKQEVKRHAINDLYARQIARLFRE